MKNTELGQAYPKVILVIASCKTIAQYNSAVKYCNLYIKLLPPHIRQFLAENIKQTLEIKKKQLLRFLSSQ